MRVGLMMAAGAIDSPAWSDAIGMYRALRLTGHTVFLFTSDGKSNSPISTYHYADLPLILHRSDDVIIYHYIGNDEEGLTALRRTDRTVLIRFHGISAPADYPDAPVPFLRELKFAREGVAKLRELKYRALICTTERHRRQFETDGVDPAYVHVLAPFSRAETLRATPDVGSVLNMLSGHAFNMVALGSVTPNKKLIELVDALSELSACKDSDAHLHIIGSHETPRIQSYLDRLGEKINSSKIGSKIHIYGRVDDHALATFLRHSDVMLSLVDHRGFDVGLVEAMSFGLPIIAGSGLGPSGDLCSDISFVEGKREMQRALNRLLSEDDRRPIRRDRLRSHFETHHSFRVRSSQFADMMRAGISAPVRLLGAYEIGRKLEQWYGLPDVALLVDNVLAVCPNLLGQDFFGMDTGRDFVYWALTEGPNRSDWLQRYVSSGDLRSFAETLYLPPIAEHLPPTLKLIWTFSRYANSRFDLSRADGLGDFMEWWIRQGTTPA